MSTAIEQHVHDGILVLTINNPPVNASSQAVRQGLVEGIDRLESEEDLRAAVVIGAGGSFVAGSDISEFGGDIPAPLLPEVIARIENSSKPVIAAIDGVALGGGLELALGCDARIATATAKLGLPEVTLGILPGAGGTQRLPRLVGRESAVEIILTGRRVTGAEAYTLGLVDAVAHEDLLSEATQMATTQVKRPVMQLSVPDHGSDLDTHVARWLGKSLRPSALAAVELVRMAGTKDADSTLEMERAEFTRFRTGPDAAALRHLFFAERAAGRRVDIPRGIASVTTAGVVGAGAMGSSICAALAMAGVEVLLLDEDPDRTLEGAERAKDIISGAIKRGKLDEPNGKTAKDRILVADELTKLSRAQIIVEAVFENIDVKTKVLQNIQIVAPQAVIATNTSYLQIKDLAVNLNDATRLVGLHFFNPAHVMKLVEVIPTPETLGEATGTALKVVKQLGKVAIVAGDHEGFIGNRINAAYRRHAEYLLEDGALPAEVDGAMEKFGFPMGPFAVADLSGLQIAQSLRDRWRAEGTLPNRYVEIPDILCERERFGRRTEKGYYDYSGEQRTTDEEVHELILQESARKGIKRRTFTDTEIIERLVGAMVLEGARVVKEGVAKHRDDIDVALVNGFGFPRYLGGPMWWASTQPTELLERIIARAADAAREDLSEDVMKVITADG